MATVRVLDIVNIGRSTISIDVAPVDDIIPEELTGTGTEIDMTGLTGGSNLFDGDGPVRILPGRRFKIEEYRVNAGQIENLVVNQQIQVLDLLRDQEALFYESI